MLRQTTLNNIFRKLLTFLCSFLEKNSYKSAKIYYKLFWTIEAISIPLVLQFKMMTASFVSLSAALILTIPAMMTIAQFIKSMLDNTWGKIIIGLLGIIVAKFSWSIAQNEIHAITYANPDNFHTTTIVISSIIGIFSWCVTICIILNVVIIVKLIKLMLQVPISIFIFRMSPNDSNEMLNLGFVITHLVLMYGINQITYNKSIFIDVVEKAIIYLDYYDKSECSNVRKNEMFAYLNNQIISIASWDDNKKHYIFRNETCYISKNNMHESNTVSLETSFEMYKSNLSNISDKLIKNIKST